MSIKKLLPRVQKNIPLAEYTTFKIGGKANYFFVAKNKEDLIKAINVAKKLRLSFFILGGGSNVLFSDRGVSGLIIKIENCKLKIENCNIYAEAGAKLDNIIKLAAKESLTGLEWAAGIPGTVGGAIYGNAGAFDYFICDSIKRVEVLNSKTLKIKKLSKNDCKFSHKDTIFKKRKNLIIISAFLKLKKGNKTEIQKKIKKYLNYRKKSHPLNLASAGCAFKNYKGKIKNQKLIKEFPEFKNFNKEEIIPTAFLIEKCGLKGKKIGDAQVSKKHANFIVNLGEAKAKDVKSLIKLAKEKVKNKFGIALEEEINT